MNFSEVFNAILPGQTESWRRFLTGTSHLRQSLYELPFLESYLFQTDALTVISGLRNTSLLDYKLPCQPKNLRRVLRELAVACRSASVSTILDEVDLIEIEGFTFLRRHHSLPSLSRQTFVDVRAGVHPTVLDEENSLRLKSILNRPPSLLGPLIVPFTASLLEYPFVYYVGDEDSHGPNSLGGVPLLLCAVVVESHLLLTSPASLLAIFPCSPTEFISHSFSVPLELSMSDPSWQTELLDLYMKRIRESKLWSGVRIVTKEVTLHEVLL